MTEFIILLFAEGVPKIARLVPPLLIYPPVMVMLELDALKVMEFVWTVPAIEMLIVPAPGRPAAKMTLRPLTHPVVATLPFIDVDQLVPLSQTKLPLASVP